MVHAAQGGNAAHTASVHVHLATWSDNTGDSISSPGAHQPHLKSPLHPRHCAVVEEGAPSSARSGLGQQTILPGTLTGTFHALVHQPVEERATVVAEGGAAVAVQTELVLVARVLGGREESFREIGLGEGPKTLREVILKNDLVFLHMHACM